MKFRAWDKRKLLYTKDFVIAPTTPEWGAFPIEQADEFDAFFKKVRERFSDKELWDSGLIRFLNSDYTLTDWANIYGLNYYIIEQSIGKLDRDGKEIFDGDILSSSNDDSGYDIWNEESIGYTAICWDHDYAAWRGMPWTPAWSDHDCESVYNIKFVRVAGNIHENYDLLTKS